MLVGKCAVNCTMFWFGDSRRCDPKFCDATRDAVVGDGCSLEGGGTSSVLNMFTSLPYRAWLPGELDSEPCFSLIGSQSFKGTYLFAERSVMNWPHQKVHGGTLHFLFAKDKKEKLVAFRIFLFFSSLPQHFFFASSTPFPPPRSGLNAPAHLSSYL